MKEKKLTCFSDEVIQDNLRATCVGYQETDELYARIVRRMADTEVVGIGLVYGVVSAITSYVKDADARHRPMLALMLLDITFVEVMIRACAPAGNVLEAALRRLPACLA